MSSPPFHQCLIVSRFVTDFPVNLWNIIINPSFTCPKQYIGIKIIIVLQTIGVTSQRITLLITINTERTDTKLHPWLDATNRFVKFLYQHIHITTTPICLIGKTSTITGKTCIIRKIQSINRIRIEIIIHVNSIYIITRHNIGHNFTDMLPAFGKCRIEI